MGYDTLVQRRRLIEDATDHEYVKDLEGGLARYLGYPATRMHKCVMAVAIAPVEARRGWMAEGVKGWWKRLTEREIDLGELAGAQVPADYLRMLCDVYVHGRSRAFIADAVRQASNGRVRLTDGAVKKRLSRARLALFRSVARVVG